MTGFETFAEIDQAAAVAKVQLVRRMSAKGLSQQDAAEKLRTTQPTISRLCAEHGITWPYAYRKPRKRGRSTCG